MDSIPCISIAAGIENMEHVVDADSIRQPDLSATDI